MVALLHAVSVALAKRPSPRLRSVSRRRDGRSGSPWTSADTEQASRDIHALPAHDGVRGVSVAQIVLPCICHDPGRMQHCSPASPIGHAWSSFLPCSSGEYPLPPTRFRRRPQVAPRRLRQAEHALVQSWRQSASSR